MTLTGCTAKKDAPLHGQEQIEALREEAKTWSSGRYLFTDLKTGGTDRVFSFMYEPDGSQTSLYEQVTDGIYHAEYYSRGTLCVYDGENVSVYNTSSEGYESYNKDNPHPYSTGDLFFYIAPCVMSSAESTDGKGNITYLYNYNTDRINQTMDTSYTKFVTAYTFDSEGNFLYFTLDNSGDEDARTYMIEMIGINSLTEIENPMMAE